MGRFARKLRIGEKIGFGFGIVGFLFLAVIWQYHFTLQQALLDYRQLDDISGARKSQALAIEIDMLEAQRAENHFLVTRAESAVREVVRNLEQARENAVVMAAIDEPAAQVAEKMSRLMNDYGERFQNVVDAWRIKGLDHNSGLQGAFRDTVHELEEMAGRLEVDRLSLILLQIRRSEKDLGLRREPLYRDRVHQLIESFEDEVASSDISQGLRARLLNEIETYRETFGIFAAEILASENKHDGKGPFREAAHRIENLLNTHYVPELGKNLLQLRRREKDYLLRGDLEYVDMAIRELGIIRNQVEISQVSTDDKEYFLDLLENYRRDFLALVEQNARITRLSNEMRLAVTEIEGLVRDNVVNANHVMKRMRLDIDTSTSSDERLMLWIVAIGTALGVFLAIGITLQIIGPLREMADLLDHLASEETADRIPFHPGGRDEVNAMAGSVNAMADHKSGFIAWWKASMGESDAISRLEALLGSPSFHAEACKPVVAEIKDSIEARQALLSEQYHKVHRLNGQIVKRADELLDDIPSGSSQTALNGIYYAARSVQTVLEMAAYPDQETKNG
ncbi:MAG: HAMP domain-containing protein [Gammaproteobacteria bacterium]|nr:HAMP domain-containing protein [Gammaproteobacteria bacterium]